MADDTFIGSKEPALNGYGQNGYQGPASDLPGQHTTSGFLPQAVVPETNWQTRHVKAEAYPTTHSMRDRNASPEKIPSHNIRRAPK